MSFCGARTKVDPNSFYRGHNGTQGHIIDPYIEPILILSDVANGVSILKNLDLAQKLRSDQRFWCNGQILLFMICDTY